MILKPLKEFKNNSLLKKEQSKPYISNIKYFKYNVFYSKGYSLINRILTNGYYERDLCKHLEKELKGIINPVFLDIGANIGLISIFLISRIKKLKIFAFEPGPHQYNLFNLTIKNNNLNEKICLYNKALSYETGVAKFATHEEKDVSGDGFLDTGRAGNSKIIDVNIETLDHWWDEISHKKIDLIKMDTEGAELWILQGAKNFLLKSKPIIYFEINEENLKPYPYKSKDILNWFNENDYKMYSFDNHIINLENLDYYLKKYDTFIARAK